MRATRITGSKPGTPAVSASPRLLRRLQEDFKCGCGSWEGGSREEFQGAVLARRDGILCSVDCETFRTLRLFGKKDDVVHAMGWLQSGSLVACGLANGDVCIWDANDGSKVARWPAHNGGVLCLSSCSPQQATALNMSFVTGGADWAVRCWTSSGQQVWVGQSHNLSVRSVCICFDEGLLWSGADDKTIKTWSLAGMSTTSSSNSSDQQVEVRGSMPFGGSVLTMSHYPGNRSTRKAQVWVGGERNSIGVYDAISSALISDLKAHKGWVNCLQLAGIHMWSGSADKTAICWNAEAFQPLHVINEHSSYLRAIFSFSWQVWTVSADSSACVFVSDGVFEDMSQEQVALQKAIQQYQAQVKQLEEAKLSLQETASDSRHHLQKVNEELMQVKQQRDKEQAKNDSLNQQLNESQTQSSESSSRLKSSEQRASNAESRVAELEKLSADLQGKLVHAQSGLKQADIDLQQSQQNAAAKESLLAEESKRKQDLQRLLDETESERAEQRNQLEQLAEVKQELQAKVQDMEKQMNRQQELYSESEQNLKKQMEQSTAENQDRVRECEQLASTVETLKQKSQASKLQYEKLEKESEALQNSLHQAREELKQQAATHAILEEKLTTRTAENEALQKSADTSQQQVQQLQEQMAAKDAELIAQENRLKKFLDEIESEKSSRHGAQEDKAAAEKTILESKAMLERVSEEKNDLLQRLEKLQQDMGSLEKQREEATSALQDCCTAKSEALSRIEKLQEELRDARSLELASDQVSQQLEDLKVQYADVQTENEELQERLSVQQRELEKASTVSRDHQQLIERNDNNERELESCRHRINDMQLELQQLKDELASRESHMQKMREEVSAGELKSAENDQKLMSLQEEVQTLSQKLHEQEGIRDEERSLRLAAEESASAQDRLRQQAEQQAAAATSRAQDMEQMVAKAASEAAALRQQEDCDRSKLASELARTEALLRGVLSRAERDGQLRKALEKEKQTIVLELSENQALRSKERLMLEDSLRNTQNQLAAAVERGAALQANVKQLEAQAVKLKRRLQESDAQSSRDAIRIQNLEGRVENAGNAMQSLDVRLSRAVEQGKEANERIALLETENGKLRDAVRELRLLLQKRGTRSGDEDNKVSSFI